MLIILVVLQPALAVPVGQTMKCRFSNDALLETMGATHLYMRPMVERQVSLRLCPWLEKSYTINDDIVFCRH